MRAKYVGLAISEGAATGAAGLVGIPVDIAALTGLNLRAIGEYATYCGFDMTLQSERLFTLSVLSAELGAADGAPKVAAVRQLAQLAQDVAAKKAWKDLEQHAFAKLLRQVAKALGIRLTKAKLAQVIPMAGAAVGGGFNGYFANSVCNAAYFLYRERFLVEKYGAELGKSGPRS